MKGQNTGLDLTLLDDPSFATLGLRERKKLLRLKRIVSAARELFMKKGFSSTTIQDIAAEADVGLGTLYLYAKSKEDLLVMVFKSDLMSMIEEAYEQIDPEAPILDQLMAFFECHIRYHGRDKSLSRTVLKELSFSNTDQRREDIDQITRRTYDKLIKLIENAKQNGMLKKDVYIGTAAWSAFALNYHLLQGYLCDFHDETEFRKSLRNGLAAIFT